MELKFQDENFVVAWMHCLNNFACRKLAMKILKIKNVGNMTFESKSFKHRINRSIETKKGICIVKNFGEECHWMFVSKQKKIDIYNTSSEFDMENVKTCIKSSVNELKYEKLQRKDDCFCQTWSLVCAYACIYNKKPCRKLFNMIVNKLWKSNLFRAWIQFEELKLIKEKRGFFIQK